MKIGDIIATERRPVPKLYSDALIVDAARIFSDDGRGAIVISDDGSARLSQIRY